MCRTHVWTVGVGAIEGTRTSEAVKCMYWGDEVNVGRSDFITNSCSAWKLLSIKGWLYKRACYVSHVMQFRHSRCIIISCQWYEVQKVAKMHAYPSFTADVHSSTFNVHASIFILWFLWFDFLSVKYSIELGGSQKTKQSLHFKRRDMFWLPPDTSTCN